MKYDYILYTTVIIQVVFYMYGKRFVSTAIVFLWL